MLKTASILILILFSFSAMSVYAAPKDKVDLLKANNAYKVSYMSLDGRIMDGKKQNITTSEGQSYMMLRAVLVGDKRAFDLAYKWANNNLRRQDFLYSWLWGQNEKDDKWGVLDSNSASDADVYIAYSLLLASQKWNSQYYKTDAINLLKSIWENETKIIDGNRVLKPGVQQSNNELNPSYFTTYMFKIFAKYDKERDWNSIVDSSYNYLERNVSVTNTGLPSNWFNVENGDIVVSDTDKGDFSYDAARVFLNMYVDYKYTKDLRALSILNRLDFFTQKWKLNPDFYTNYKADGTLRNEYYFTGALAIINTSIYKNYPKISEKIYLEQLLPFIIQSGFYVKAPNMQYYSNNLLWFAMYYKQS